MQKIIQSLLDLLYPPRCHACRSMVELGADLMLCPACLEEMSFLHSPLCTCCGKPHEQGGGEDHFCSACLKQQPDFTCARSYVHYKQPARSLLHRLKFNGDTGAAQTLVKAIDLRGSIKSARAYDLIVPVPLHPVRLKRRGLNQSLVLARLLFPDRRVKIAPDVLVRLKNTVAQTGLDGAARRKNLRGAFATGPAIAVQNLKILLVDDIYTTGTTVGECAKTLKGSGAAAVDVVTIARA